MLEAMVMLNQGIQNQTIDQAAEGFGMPMSPIELADQIGVYICLHVAEMPKSSNPDLPDQQQWLKYKVAKSELGKKTGRGPLRLEGRPRGQTARSHCAAARND